MDAPYPIALFRNQPASQNPPQNSGDLALPGESSYSNPFLDPNPPLTMVDAGLEVRTTMPGEHGTPPGPSAVPVQMSPPTVFGGLNEHRK